MKKFTLCFCLLIIGSLTTLNSCTKEKKTDVTIKCTSNSVAPFNLQITTNANNEIFQSGDQIGEYSHTINVNETYKKKSGTEVTASASLTLSLQSDSNTYIKCQMIQDGNIIEEQVLYWDPVTLQTNPRFITLQHTF